VHSDDEWDLKTAVELDDVLEGMERSVCRSIFGLELERFMSKNVIIELVRGIGGGSVKIVDSGGSFGSWSWAGSR